MTSLLSFFYAVGLLLVCINQTREPIMQNTIEKVVVFRAHLPEHIAFVKNQLSQGKKVLIHTDQVTPEVGELGKNPMVQTRLGSPENLTDGANFILN